MNRYEAREAEISNHLATTLTAECNCGKIETMKSKKAARQLRKSGWRVWNDVLLCPKCGRRTQRQ